MPKLLHLVFGFLTSLTIACIIFFNSSLFVKNTDTFQWNKSKKDNEDINLRDLNVHSTDHRGFVNNEYDDNSVALQLRDEVRVLCWVMTGPQNHDLKARHIKNTWGKRCNILLFMSSQQDDDLPAIALPVKEGRDKLWAKTKLSFEYVYEHYKDQADWFYKADDDTYVIVENLRYLLKPYNPNSPLYFGCRFKAKVKQGYMSGGAGYVLSKESLRLFVEKGVHNASICRQSDEGDEDVEMGICMENLHVEPVDTRDDFDRGRFFPMGPEFTMFPDREPQNLWYWDFMYYDIVEGPNCCSDHLIAFHYISPQQLYIMEYLIYHVRPYGIYQRKPTNDDVWR